MNLKGKIILLTGGARVGLTVAEEFMRRGASLVLTYRQSGETIQEKMKFWKDKEYSTAAYSCDLSSPGSAEALMWQVEKDQGGIDGLIHMASIYAKNSLAELETQSAARAAAWEKNMNIHARAAYELALLCAPHMRKRGGGRIVTVTDWTTSSARPRYRDYIPYQASKAALEGLTRSLALELAPDILVNAVSPGPILPPPDITPEAEREVVENTPLKKWGGAMEVAKAVLFLFETDFITGETIRVDGGRHLY